MTQKETYKTEIVQKGKKFFGVFCVVAFLLLTPCVVGAQSSGLIPCGVSEDSQSATSQNTHECGFGDLLVLINNIIGFLIALTIPIAAISFAYAGFLFVTAGGDPGKISKGKEVFWRVFWGLLIVLTAWLLVYLITSVLLRDDAINFLEGDSAATAVTELVAVIKL